VKILFIPFTPSLAHMTRCLSIAETMKMEHAECLFAVGTEGRDFIEKAGFPINIIPEIDSDTFKNDRGWKWLSKSYFVDNLIAELKIIDGFRPDLIIYDFRFTTSLSARIRSTKSISILHANALSLALNTKRTAMDIISSADVLKKSFREMVFQYLFSKVFCWFVQRPVNRIKTLLKQYHYNGIRNVFELLLGDINFIADTPEFIPVGFMLPANCHLIGPLIWSGWDRADNFSFDNSGSKPVIYVTMGSTIEAKPTLLKLIESLRDLPYHIIISKGKTGLDLLEIPSNVSLYSFVPGNVVASKSSLAIYHGGHETLMQVLSCGVPSMVIPVNPDQIMVAKQIKKLGLGNYLKRPHSFPMEPEPLKNFSTHEIAAEVIRIIEDTECKQRCEIMRKTLTGYINSKEYLKFIHDIHREKI
jgi:UDP:flavonoid glycosyltransferase YjiC (YdhE family)